MTWEISALKIAQIDKNKHFSSSAANTIIAVSVEANYIVVGSQKNESLTIILIGGKYGRRSHPRP